MSAASILRQAETLKAAVKETSRGSSEAWVKRQQLQDLYQRLLVIDLEYALDKKVEQELWNHAFKNQINTFQTQVKDKSNPKRNEIQASFNLFLETTSGFYLQLLQEICSAHDLNLSFRKRSTSIGILKEYGPPVNKVKLPKHSSSLYICQHCLVHLGDVARYRQHVEQAQTFYRHAARLVPSNGQPYNQLAILEAAKGNKLANVFYYLRSVAVKHPFPVAGTNMEKLYTKLSKVTHDLKGKLSMNDIITVFLQFHAFIHQNLDLSRAKSLSERIAQNLTPHITSLSFTSRQLLHMVNINLYALHRAKTSLSPSGAGSKGVTSPSGSTTSSSSSAGDVTGSGSAGAGGVGEKGNGESTGGSREGGISGGAGKSSVVKDKQERYDTVFKLTLHLFDLMLQCTPRQESKARDYLTLPAIKTILDWFHTDRNILAHPTFKSFTIIWPNLARTLNNLQLSSNTKHGELEKYHTMPLPEDIELQGFLPNEKAHKYVEMDRMPAEGLGEELEISLRCYRLVQHGLWISDEFPSLNLLNVQKLKNGRHHFSAPTPHVKVLQAGTDAEGGAGKDRTTTTVRQNVAIQAIMQNKNKKQAGSDTSTTVATATGTSSKDHRGEDATNNHKTSHHHHHRDRDHHHHHKQQSDNKHDAGMMTQIVPMSPSDPRVQKHFEAGGGRSKGEVTVLPAPPHQGAGGGDRFPMGIPPSLDPPTPRTVLQHQGIRPQAPGGGGSSSANQAPFLRTPHPTTPHPQHRMQHPGFPPPPPHQQQQQKNEAFKSMQMSGDTFQKLKQQNEAFQKLQQQNEAFQKLQQQNEAFKQMQQQHHQQNSFQKLQQHNETMQKMYQQGMKKMQQQPKPVELPPAPALPEPPNKDLANAMHLDDELRQLLMQMTPYERMEMGAGNMLNNSSPDPTQSLHNALGLAGPRPPANQAFNQQRTESEKCALQLFLEQAQRQQQQQPRQPLPLSSDPLQIFLQQHLESSRREQQQQQHPRSPAPNDPLQMLIQQHQRQQQQQQQHHQSSNDPLQMFLQQQQQQQQQPSKPPGSSNNSVEQFFSMVKKETKDTPLPPYPPNLTLNLPNPNNNPPPTSSPSTNSAAYLFGGGGGGNVSSVASSLFPSSQQQPPQNRMSPNHPPNLMSPGGEPFAASEGRSNPSAGAPNRRHSDHHKRSQSPDATKMPPSPIGNEFHFPPPPPMNLFGDDDEEYGGGGLNIRLPLPWDHRCRCVDHDDRKGQEVPKPDSPPSGANLLHSLFGGPMKSVGARSAEDTESTNGGNQYSLFGQSGWNMPHIAESTSSKGSSPGSSSIRSTPDPSSDPRYTADRGATPEQDTRNYDSMQTFWSSGPSPLERLLEQQKQQRQHTEPPH